MKRTESPVISRDFADNAGFGLIAFNGKDPGPIDFDWYSDRLQIDHTKIIKLECFRG